jgi:hypothetical protein
MSDSGVEEILRQLASMQSLQRFTVEALLDLLGSIKHDEKTRSRMRGEVADIKAKLAAQVKGWDKAYLDNEVAV